MQGTTEFHHQIADALLPQTEPLFDDAAMLDTAVDMVNPQPTMVEFLVRHVLLSREFLPQIEINSTIQMFLAWTKQNPQYMSEPPVDSIFRFLESRFPCRR